MGDAEKADPALIPDLSPFDTNPITATYWGQTHLPVNYLLMQDNLMDFSHIDHLHTAFDSGGCSSAKPTVRRNNGRVDIDWAWESERPFAFLAPFTKEGSVDSWIHVTWHAPSVIIARLGSTPRGRPREEGASFFGVHVLCPETERSTFQGFALTRNYAQADVEYTHQTQKGLDIVNETEDVPELPPSPVSPFSTVTWRVKASKGGVVFPVKVALSTGAKELHQIYVKQAPEPLH